MRARLVPLLVLCAAAAIVSPAVADASDERHDRRVGSLRDFPGPVAPTQGPATSAAPPPGADPVANGIAIGAAIGAGTGLALMGWAYAQCNDTCDAPEPAPMYLMAGSMGAAVGGVVGFIVDKVRKNTSQRVTIGGAVTPTRRQVHVAVRW
jgi:hypothetical protein